MSRNPGEQMFIVQISLLIATFLSLISRNLSIMQTTKEVNPHPHIASCVNMWSVTFLCGHLLNVGAYIRHITQEGQVEWTTLAYVMGKRIQIVLTSPLCYSIVSHATLILQYHASMLTLRNSVISQALWLPQVWYYTTEFRVSTLSWSCVIIPSIPTD